MAERDAMTALVELSRLLSLTVDISDNDVPTAADRIADWLAQTGGLHSPWR